MKHLAVLFAALFALSGLPALASAASTGAVRAPSVSASSCRGAKKKGKDDKKAYGFEL